MINTVGRTIPELICLHYGIKNNMTAADFTAVFDNHFSKLKDSEISGAAMQVFTFAAWYSGGKQIYRFDPSLCDCLNVQSSEDLDIDGSVISSLPCNSFFVDCTVGDFIGFFCAIDNPYAYGDNIGDKYHSLVLCPVLRNGIISLCEYRIADDKTIFKTMLDCIVEHDENAAHMAQTLIATYAHINSAAPFLQYLIYLAAINAEIVPSTRYAVAKQGQRKRLRQAQKDGGVQISHVGYRFGNTYRAQTERKIYPSSDTEAHGTPKTPHIRRSHFHSYWTGTGAEKKLIVKWINTIFVNGGNPDTATVHKVK